MLVKGVLIALILFMLGTPPDQKYHWWSIGAGRDKYAPGESCWWAKLGPVSVCFGRFLFADQRLAFELHALNRMLWKSY